MQCKCSWYKHLINCIFHGLTLSCLQRVSPEMQAQTSAVLESSVSIPLNRLLIEWVSECLPQRITLSSILTLQSGSFADSILKCDHFGCVIPGRINMQCWTSPLMLWTVWTMPSGTPLWYFWTQTVNRVWRTWGPGCVRSPERVQGNCMSVPSNWGKTTTISSPVCADTAEYNN